MGAVTSSALKVMSVKEGEGKSGGPFTFFLLALPFSTSKFLNEGSLKRELHTHQVAWIHSLTHGGTVGVHHRLRWSSEGET